LEDLEDSQEQLEQLRSSGVDPKYIQSSITKLETKIISIEKAKTSLERQIASEEKDQLQVNVGAMIDVYYTYNMNHEVPSGAEGSNSQSVGRTQRLRNYDQKHNDITMNMFEINFSGKVRNVGFYADLDFGPFADQNSGHSDLSCEDTDSDGEVNSCSDGGDAVGHNIGQAYLTYEKSGYTFSAGKMYTNVGFEVAKAQENWNYSRSFSFSWGGPFWHEGVSLTKGYDSGFGWGLYIYDNWDSRSETNDNKTYSIQLNYSKDKLGVIYNYITGLENEKRATYTDDDGDTQPLRSESKEVHEINATYSINNRFTVAVDALTGRDSKTGANEDGDVEDYKWTGSTLYVRYVNGDFSITPRLETFTFQYFDASDSNFQAEDGTAIDDDKLTFTGTTITFGYNLTSASEVRLEYRQDAASEDYYLNKKSDDIGKTQSMVSLAWLMTI
jgi:hypothetical protein